MSDDSNGRIEYIREDFQKLERKMEEGFDNVMDKLEDARKERLAEKQDIYNHCSTKRKVLTEKISDNEENIESLDKKINIVAFASGGVGFILGLLAKEYIPQMIALSEVIKWL